MSEYIYKRNYDKERGLFIINGTDYTNHCHRFLSIALRTAIDAKKIVDGPKILEISTEDSLRKVLLQAYEEQNATTIKQKIEIATAYYSWAGLGLISFDTVTEMGGEVSLSVSHADLGWELMLGEANEPINFITKGFIAAAFGTFYGKRERLYNVVETESIILGSDKSKFKVNLL